MSDSNCPQCGNRVGNGGCVCQAGMTQGQAMATATPILWFATQAAQMNQLAGRSGSLGQAAQLQGTALLSHSGKPTPKQRVPRPRTRLDFVRDLQEFLMDRKSDFASDPAFQSMLFLFLLEDV